MAKGRRVIKCLTPFTDTVATMNGSFSDAYVKNWDKEAGAGQAMVQVRRRTGMGIKKTPIGKGVTTRGS